MNQPCPYCGRTDTTQIDTSLDARWHCLDCNSLFHGTAAEYAQWELRRLAFRDELGLTETGT